jgi:hypothetical protein
MPLECSVSRMGAFMGKRRVITVRVLETLEWRHLDRIGCDAVKRAISAMSDGGSHGNPRLVPRRTAKTGKCLAGAGTNPTKISRMLGQGTFRSLSPSPARR